MGNDGLRFRRFPWCLLLDLCSNIDVRLIARGGLLRTTFVWRAFASFNDLLGGLNLKIKRSHPLHGNGDGFMSSLLNLYANTNLELQAWPPPERSKILGLRFEIVRHTLLFKDDGRFRDGWFRMHGESVELVLRIERSTELFDRRCL